MQSTESPWLSITEVCNATGMAKSTLKELVLSAGKQGENWVKLVDHPAPRRWMIDTHHETYQAHLLHWQARIPSQKIGHKGREKRKIMQRDRQARSSKDALLPGTRPRGESIKEIWPELCHALANHGLIVFENALTGAHGWQWSWNGSGETGYPDAKSAILGALQSQLTSQNQRKQSDEFLLPYSFDGQHKETRESGRNGFFHWKR